LSTELSSIQRRQLVDKFLQMAFPPSGIGMGTAQKDQLGLAFKTKPTGQAAVMAVNNFLAATNASVAQATKGEMVRTLETFA